MTFFLKKLISAFLLPLPFGLLLILLGLLCVIFGAAKRLRIFCIFIGFLCIFLFSTNPVSNALLDKLQSQYAPLTVIPTQVDKVVVLGGGAGVNKNYPANITLGSASLSRLVEGIRLFHEVYKHHANARLILSGGRVYRAAFSAGKMQNTAVMLGVARNRIILENGSLDTHDEARYLQKILGNKPFILVTSAYHMPRAMAFFEELNMHPIAAPTQLTGAHSMSIHAYIPNTINLMNSDTAIHEYLGMVWGRMRGYY